MRGQAVRNFILASSFVFFECKRVLLYTNILWPVEESLRTLLLVLHQDKTDWLSGSIAAVLIGICFVWWTHWFGWV